MKYRFDKQTVLYAVAAMLKQGASVQYALGMSGHGVPIAPPRDDNDKTDKTDKTISGQTLCAISVGMQYVF